jgi:putative ABC transport system permease protein
MIGLPIAVLSCVAAVVDMAILTPSEQLSRQMGTASASLAWNSAPVTQDLYSAARVGGISSSSDPHTAAQVLALLPAGSTVTPTWTSAIAMYTAGGVGRINATGLDVANPITTGMVRVIHGHSPRTADEVALSPQTMVRLNAHIGGTVRTVTTDKTYRVVAEVEVAGNHRDQSIVFASSERPGVASPGAYNVRWLVAQPTAVRGDQIQALNSDGIFVTSRYLVLHPPPRQLVHVSGSDVQSFGVGTLLVGLAVLEVVLLAGPAFAVGARRRQRELALVATAGGTPATLRRIVLADGIVGGLLAAMVGLIVGIGVAFGGRGLLEARLSDSRFGAYRMYPWAVVGVVVVAVGIGLLGALLPAITAGRQDIVASLSGRRGTAHASRRWLIGGVILIVVGGLTAAYGAYGNRSGTVLAGLALSEFGLVMCTPTVVGLIGRVGRFLPVAPRLALRDAARRRSASAPAIAAVMAAVAGSVAISVYVTGQRATQTDVYASAIAMGAVSITTSDFNTGDYVAAPLAALTGAARTVMPAASVTPFQLLSCPSTSGAEQPAGLCNAIAVEPDDRMCPFSEYGGQLTKLEQRQALADPRCNTSSIQHFVMYGTPPVVTDSPAVVAAISGLRGRPLDEAVATLRSGGILVDDPALVENGKARLSTDNGSGKADGTIDLRQPSHHTTSVAAYAVTTGVRWFQPVFSPSLLRQFHNNSVAAGVLVSDRPSTSPTDSAPVPPNTVPSQATEDALNALALGVSANTNIYVERGDTTLPDRGPAVSLILAAAAAVIALGAAAIATGLAAADSRRDLLTLGAVGATPRVRRVLSLAQAAVIAGTGSLIGVVAGLGAAAAILTGLNHQWTVIWPKPAHYPIVIPWWNILIALVAVPLVAMLGAGLLTRSRLPSERRAD